MQPDLNPLFLWNIGGIFKKGKIAFKSVQLIVNEEKTRNGETNHTEHRRHLGKKKKKKKEKKKEKRGKKEKRKRKKKKYIRNRWGKKKKKKKKSARVAQRNREKLSSVIPNNSELQTGDTWLAIYHLAAS
ncbi:hypothetical protein llap_15811 [Limosa lapponica baueri]|uniref:Uncharacterized protein n=1 Tax=Limosa lapponica baueri TaxID=1758121 RepID=A0A2I0TJE2_LIMLA|nr:hypothetical protein llap_15811 [Limosa lapponica baueri]